MISAVRAVPVRVPSCLIVVVILVLKLVVPGVVVCGLVGLSRIRVGRGFRFVPVIMVGLSVGG